MTEFPQSQDTDQPHSKTMITYTKNEPVGQPAYYACFYGDTMLGTLEMCCDGFYYFEPVKKGGFWESALLKDLAFKLEALNESWKKRIDEELAKISR